MCLLIVCPPNKTPKRDELERGACVNPHGFGFAMIAEGKVLSFKSMSAKKTIARFLELREQHPDGYAIFHSRYATHGVKNEANCHPFVVGGDEDSYLAHNGVLDVEIEKNDKRSDTRVFAEDILPKLGGVSALDDPNIWKLVSGWSRGSKIAILTVNPNALESCYLINEEAGEWEEGIWFSNSSHKPTITYDYKPYIGSSYSYKYDSMSLDLPEYAFTICHRCALESESWDGYCQWCACCLECDQESYSCLCYTPSGSIPSLYGME